MATYELLYADDDYCAGLVGPVLALIAQGHPKSIVVGQGRQWAKRVASERPDGGAFIVVVRSDAPVPSEEARGYIRSWIEECQRFAKAGSFVIEGQGFLAAALRGALTTVTLVARLPYPLKVHGTIDEGAAFIVAKLGRKVGMGSRDLGDSILELRRDYESGMFRAVTPARRAL